MGKFINDFKEFAIKGNVIDMAVGVIIGGAFGKIVTSMVNDMIMPLIGVITGGVNFTDLKWIIQPEKLAADGTTVESAAVSVNYGMFVQNVVDFLIIAFCIFVIYSFSLCSIASCAINLNRDKALSFRFGKLLEQYAQWFAADSC